MGVAVLRLCGWRKDIRYQISEIRYRRSKGKEKKEKGEEGR